MPKSRVFMTRTSAAAAPEANDDTNSGQHQGGTNEHPPERSLLCPERKADSDFASALRNGVRDDSVDADETEGQRHCAGNRQHDERE